jgi:hypothetical protein
MIRTLRGGSPLGKTASLRDYVRKQPPGYCDADSSTSSAAFVARVNELLHQYVGQTKAYAHERHEAVNLVQFFPGFPIIDWRLCPIHLINDGSRLGIPEGLVRFIACIDGNIDESPSFVKQLSRLPAGISKKWDWAKTRLRYSTLDKGLDFKPWKIHGQDVYSIRLSRQHRAHLEHDRQRALWTAIEVGTHKAMGHG